MPAPTAYDRLKNFTQYALDHTSAPYNASDHDAELDAIEATLDSILANLTLIQRDDGNLRNQSVGPDSLNAATKALIGAGRGQNGGAAWTPRGLWETATEYEVGDVVEQDGISYVCAADHTAGTFSTDHTAGKWVLLAGVGQNMLFTPYSYLAATNVQAALEELVDDLAASSGASRIGYTPYSYLAATNVQDALEELVDDLGASSGASRIGYTQSGIALTPRSLTVQQRLRTGAKLLSEYFDVEGGSTDASEAIESFLNACATAGVDAIIDPGIYRLDNEINFTGGGTSPDPNTGAINVYRYGCEFRVNHDGIGFKWGTTSRKYRINVFGGKLVSWDGSATQRNWVPGHYAEQFLNTNCCKHFDYDYYGFERGLSLLGNNGQGQSYLESRPRSIIDCKYPVHMTAEDTGWCNENLVTGNGSIAYSSSAPDATGAYAVYIGATPGASNAPNNNKVIGVSLENSKSSDKPKAVYIDGFYCHVIAPRIEGFDSPAIVLEAAIPASSQRGHTIICGRGIEVSEVQNPQRAAVILGNNSHSISGGGLTDTGSGATATATRTGEQVTSISVDTAGSGYNVPPTVTISGGGGSGAKAFATINTDGEVTAITVVDQGQGYTTDPTVTLTAAPWPVQRIQNRSSTSGLNPLLELMNATGTRVARFFSDGGLSLGSNGGVLKQILVGRKTATLSSLADGATTSLTVSVPNAQAGQPVFTGITGLTAGTGGWKKWAEVTASGTVTVWLTNNSGSTSNDKITVTAMVFQPD